MRTPIPAPLDNRKLLSAKEITEIYGIRRTSLYNAKKRDPGFPPEVRPFPGSNVVKYQRDQIERWLGIEQEPETKEPPKRRPGRPVKQRAVASPH